MTTGRTGVARGRRGRRRRGHPGRRVGRPGSWLCRGSRPGRRRQAVPGRAGRSEARAIRQRRLWSAAAVMAWLRRAAVDRALAPASGAGLEIESRRSHDRRTAMHLHPRRGMWVESRFCRCRSWTVATVPSSPRIWTRTRPIAISLTVLTHVRRSHLRHRLGSPFLPDLFGPRDATVHL